MTTQDITLASITSVFNANANGIATTIKGTALAANLPPLASGYALSSDLNGVTSWIAVAGSAPALSAVLSAGNTSNNIGVSLTGTAAFQTRAGLVLLDNGGASAVAITLQAPAAVTSAYTLKLPTGVGSAAQFLQTDGAGNLTWATASTATPTLQQVLGGTGGNTANNLNLVLTGTGSLQTTAGLTLNDTTSPTPVGITLAAPATVTSAYTLTLPAAQGALNQSLVNNGSGVLSWRSFATPTLDAVLAVTGGNTSSHSIVLTSTANLQTTGGVQLNSTGGGAVTMQAAAGSTTSYSLQWPNAQSPASMVSVLVNDGSGTLTWDVHAQLANLLSVLNNGNSAANQDLILTGTGKLQTTAGLQLNSTSNTNTAVIKAPSSISTSYTWTLPSVQGNSGQQLTNDGNGALAWYNDFEFIAVVGSQNIATLSGLLVVDGYTTVVGDLALLTAQTDPTQNGLWVVASGNWSRNTTYQNQVVFPENGTANGNRMWARQPAAGNEVWVVVAGPTAVPNLDSVLAMGATSARSITLSGTAYISASSLKLSDQNTTPNVVTLNPSASMTAGYTLTLPSARGLNQQFLQTDGSGNLSWAAAPSPGASVTLTDVLTNSPGGAANLNLILTDTGYFSTALGLEFTLASGSTNTFTLLSPPTLATSYTLSWPTAIGTDGQVLKTDATGQLGWASLPSVNLTNVLTNSPTGADNLPLILTGRGGLFSTAAALQFTGVSEVGSVPHYIRITPPSFVNADTVLSWPDTKGTNGQVLSRSGEDAMAWLSLPGVPDLQQVTSIAAISSNTILLTGSAYLQTRAGIQWYDTSTPTTKTVTIATPTTLTSTYALTLPAAQASGASFLQNDGSGILSWSNSSSQSIVLTSSALLSTIAGVQFNGASSGNITLSAPSAVSTSYSLKLPAALPSAAQFLQTDTSGNLSWAAALTSAPGLAEVLTKNPSASNLNLTLTGTGQIATTAGVVLNGFTSGALSLVANATTTSYTITLPAAVGATGTVLTSADGTGATSWATPTGVPGGSTNQFQFNNGGAFAGASGLTYNKSTNTAQAVNAPVGSTDLARLADVQAAQSGLRPEIPTGTTAHIAESAVSGTYTNGTGIGNATLVGTTQLTVAGLVPAANDWVVLVDQEASATGSIQNGSYVVTSNTSTAFTLTRTNVVPAFGNFYVATAMGATNYGVQYENVTIGTITVGTTPIVFSLFGVANPNVPALEAVTTSGNVTNRGIAFASSGTTTPTITLGAPATVTSGYIISLPGSAAPIQNAPLVSSTTGITSWGTALAVGTADTLLNITAGTGGGAIQLAGTGTTDLPLDLRSRGAGSAVTISVDTATQKVSFASASTFGLGMSISNASGALVITGASNGGFNGVYLGSVGSGNYTLNVNSDTSNVYLGLAGGTTGRLNIAVSTNIGQNQANYLGFSGAAASSAPTISALGSDTNVGIALAPKGTGVVSISTSLQLAGATSGAITLKAAAATSAYTLTLPAAVGAANQVLTTNASGNLSWTTPLAPPTLTSVLTNNNSAANLNLILTGSGQLKTTAGLVLTGATSGSVSLTVADGGAQAYNLNFPVAAPATNGQVLVASTTGQLSWSSVVTNIPGVQAVLNVGASSATGMRLTDTATYQTTAGVVLNDTTSSPPVGITLKGPTTVPSAYTLTFPAASPGSGQTLISDSSGVLSWSTPSGTPTLLAVLTSSNTAANKDLILSGSGLLQTSAGLQFNGSVTGAMTVKGPASITGVYTLTLPGAAPSAAAFLQSAATGITSWTLTSTLNLSAILANGNTASTSLTLTGAAVLSTVAGLQLAGSTSGNITLKAPASPTSYSLTLPSAQGSANNFLQNDGAGNLSWASALTSTPGLTAVLMAGPTANNLNLTLTGTGQLQTTAGLQLIGSTSSNAIALVAPAATAAYQLTLPAASGASGQVLMVDGNTPSVASWAYPSAQIAAVATTNIASLANVQTIDGYALAAGDIVLAANQITASQNGLYTVNAPGAWTKLASLVYQTVFALNGTTNGGKTFQRTKLVSPESWILKGISVSTTIPGGIAGNLQYNNNGALGGILTANYTTALTTGTATTVASSLYVGASYGVGQYVTANGSRDFYSSPDGITWTQGSTGAFLTPTGLVFGNGYFVMTCSAGGFLISNSGTGWNTVGTAGSLTCYPAYGNGLWVILNGSAVLGITTTNSFYAATAPLSANWRQSVTTFNAYFAGNVYFNNQFVAITQAGVIWTSTDGSNWATPGNVASGITLLSYSVRAAGNYMFALSSTGVSYRSSNGTTWAVYANAPFTFAWYSYDAVSGYYYASNTDSIAESADGTNWTTPIALPSNVAGPQAVTYPLNGKLLIIPNIGGQSTASAGTILYFTSVGLTRLTVPVTTLKLSGGAANQLLQTDGAGNLSFVSSSAVAPTLQQVTTAGATTTASVTLGGTVTLGNNSATYVTITGGSASQAPSISSASNSPAQTVSLFLGTQNNGSVVVGNQLLAASSVYVGSSTINALQISGAATGQTPNITTTGSDTNVSMSLTTKGTGTVILGNYSAYTGVSIVGGSTTAAQIAAIGVSSNVDLVLAPKGTGSVYLIGNTLLSGVVANQPNLYVADGPGSTVLGTGAQGQLLTSAGPSGGAPYWSTPTAGATPTLAYRYTPTTTTVPNGTDTDILWPIAAWQVQGSVGLSYNNANGVFTCTTAGFLLVQYQVLWASNTTGSRVSYLNVTTAGRIAMQDVAANNDFTVYTGMGVWYASVGDTAVFRVWQNSGGSLAFSPSGGAGTTAGFGSTISFFKLR